MSTINTGESLQRFTEDKWYAYSGVVQGDVSVPSTITLIDIPNSGLRNGFVKIQLSFGQSLSASGTQQLGTIIRIDGVEVIKHQGREYPRNDNDVFELFVPKQSRIEVISMNTSSNNTQDRACTILGWYV